MSAGWKQRLTRWAEDLTVNTVAGLLVAAVVALMGLGTVVVVARGNSPDNSTPPASTTATTAVATSTDQSRYPAEPCIDPALVKGIVGAAVEVDTSERCRFRLTAPGRAQCERNWVCTYESNDGRVVREGGDQVVFDAPTAIFRFRLAYLSTEIGKRDLCSIRAYDGASYAIGANGQRVAC